MEANVQNASASSRYGGYPREKTIYDPENIRAMVYLVETDNAKGPQEITYGAAKELFSVDAGGHVDRNLRLALLAVELAEAALRLRVEVSAEALRLYVRDYFCSNSKLERLFSNF